MHTRRDWLRLKRCLGFEEKPQLAGAAIVQNGVHRRRNQNGSIAKPMSKIVTSLKKSCCRV